MNRLHTTMDISIKITTSQSIIITKSAIKTFLISLSQFYCIQLNTQSIDKKIVMQSRDRSVPSGGFRRHFVLDVFIDLLTCLHNLYIVFDLVACIGATTTGTGGDKSPPTFGVGGPAMYWSPSTFWST